MKEKELMKISRATFGLGGYQGCMIGLHLTFSSPGSGVSDSICAWDPCKIEHTDRCKWTEESRDAEFAKICRRVSAILNDAKCDSVADLVGKPVEVSFERMKMTDWRILTEVL